MTEAEWLIHISEQNTPTRELKLADWDSKEFMIEFNNPGPIEDEESIWEKANTSLQLMKIEMHFYKICPVLKNTASTSGLTFDKLMRFRKLCETRETNKEPAGNASKKQQYSQNEFDDAVRNAYRPVGKLRRGK